MQWERTRRWPRWPARSAISIATLAMLVALARPWSSSGNGSARPLVSYASWLANADSLPSSWRIAGWLVVAVIVLGVAAVLLSVVEGRATTTLAALAAGLAGLCSLAVTLAARRVFGPMGVGAWVLLIGGVGAALSASLALPASRRPRPVVVAATKGRAR